MKILTSNHINNILSNKFDNYCKIFKIDIFNSHTHHFLDVILNVMQHNLCNLNNYAKIIKHKHNSIQFAKIIQQLKLIKDTKNNLYFYSDNFSENVNKLFLCLSKITINQLFANYFSLFLNMLIEILEKTNGISIDKNDSIYTLIDKVCKINKHVVLKTLDLPSSKTIYVDNIIFIENWFVRQADKNKELLDKYTLNDCKQLIKYLHNKSINVSDEQFNKLIGIEFDIFKTEMLNNLIKQLDIIRIENDSKLNEITYEFDKNIKVFGSDICFYDMNNKYLNIHDFDAVIEYRNLNKQFLTAKNTIITETNNKYNNIKNQIETIIDDSYIYDFAE